MTADELEWLRGLDFGPSRIPKLDALATVVPNGAEQDPAIVAAHKRSGFSRWFPVEGGHRVLFLYEGGEYDSSRFKVEPKAWDHETCKACRTHIPALTLCWVTQRGTYVVLCEACHNEVSTGHA